MYGISSTTVTVTFEQLYCFNSQNLILALKQKLKKFCFGKKSQLKWPKAASARPLLMSTQMFH